LLQTSRSFTTKQTTGWTYRSLCRPEYLFSWWWGQTSFS